MLRIQDVVEQSRLASAQEARKDGHRDLRARDRVGDRVRAREMIQPVGQAGAGSGRRR